MKAALPRVARMAFLLQVRGIGITFADGADVPYRPPVQPNLAPPKDPGKVQRAVRKKARRIDNAISQPALRRSLVNAGGIDTAHVSVFASSGAITLAGTVLEVAQIALSQQRARQARGVTEVSNRLSLGSERHRTCIDLPIVVARRRGNRTLGAARHRQGSCLHRLAVSDSVRVPFRDFFPACYQA